MLKKIPSRSMLEAQTNLTYSFPPLRSLTCVCEQTKNTNDNPTVTVLTFDQQPQANPPLIPTGTALSKDPNYVGTLCRRTCRSPALGVSREREQAVIDNSLGGD